MTPTDADLNQPAAGCSARVGLPQSDCQGRRKEPHGRGGLDAILDAVPGDPLATRDARSMMFDAYVKACGGLIDMHSLIVNQPEKLSMRQVWSDCEFLRCYLKAVSSAVVNHLNNDFPPVVRGYKDIPA